MTEPAVSVMEASALILSCIERMPVEQVPLASALGTVLAETVTAGTSVPPWHGAPMDGYAIRGGDILLAAGDRISAAAIGVLASAGVATVATYRPPTVAIISSGDNLVRLDGLDSVLNGQCVISSNSYSLPAMVRDAGARPRDGGVTPDNSLALHKAMEGAMVCDLLITSGGTSAGDGNLTHTVMHEMGADMKFSRVRVMPGSAVAFALIDGRPWIGLPGDPVSAFVAFELFVRPAILKMMGESLVYPTAQTVTLDEPMAATGAFAHFLRVIITQREDGALHARLTGTRSSGALTSMVHANGLLMIPADAAREFMPGDRLRAIPLGNSLFRSSAFPA